MTREELLAKIAEKKKQSDPGFKISDETIAKERQRIAKERQLIRMSQKGYEALYRDMVESK